MAMSEAEMAEAVMTVAAMAMVELPRRAVAIDHPLHCQPRCFLCLTLRIYPWILELVLPLMAWIRQLHLLHQEALEAAV